MVRDARFGGLLTNDPEVTSLPGAIRARAGQRTRCDHF